MVTKLIFLCDGHGRSTKAERYPKCIRAEQATAHAVQAFMGNRQPFQDPFRVWTKKTEFPTPLFIVWNAVVTAWHITDWLWQSNPEIREILARRYKLKFMEGSKTALREGLEEFQDAVAKDSRFLYVCREIANGSKHMRKNKIDPDITALARWSPVIEGAGHVVPGDFTLGLVIIDGDLEEGAERWLIQAFGYWEQVFTQEDLISVQNRLPDKVINPQP